MSIQNVKVVLDGIDLQVDTNGVQPHQISVMEVGQSWLSREKLAATRSDDDSIGFDVTMLSGKRVRVRYGPSSAVPVAVPQNNNAQLSQLYKRYKVVSYSISGTGLGNADALHFYERYSAAQTLWLQRAKLIAQLADPDISKTTVETLVTNLGTTEAQIDAAALILAMYGTNYQVVFAEGQSCQFTDWVISGHADFKFNLISRTEI